MAITLPSADEIDQYSTRSDLRATGPWDIPLIADDEAVCQVHVLETGGGAYWSRGDVDVHILYARQHHLADGLTHVAPQAWLAQALRERREQRRRLRLSGVQTTASGLVVLHTPAQLLVPARR